MPHAIIAENLGKAYRIAHQREGAVRYRTLRDDLIDMPRRALSKIGVGSYTHETLWVLKDVSFTVEQGDILGVIGRNGAGKSTLLKILSRITPPTSGRAELYGRIGSLLEVGTGFHPELTGRENVFLNGAILGMGRKEIERSFDEIVAFAEVEQFLDTPVKHYSSGMYMRLAFAVAAHLQSETLLVDEVLAVGDAAFQKKCLGKMEEVAKEGRTVLFVSHNMQAVRQMCRTVLLLERGQVRFLGDAAQGVGLYFSGDSELGSTLDLSQADRRDTGSRAAFLTAAQFLNEKGEAVAQLTRGEKLRMRISFTANRPLNGFDISMSIVHSDGTRVFSESLSDQHPLQNVPEGRHTFDMNLDLHYLKSETYFLSIYLHNDGHPIDNVDGIPMPQIEDPAADSFKEAHRWGIVRIPIGWGLPSASGL